MKLAYFTQKKLENKILHHTKLLFFMIHWIPWNISPTQKRTSFELLENESFLLPCSTNGFFPKLKSDLINEIFLCTCALHDARDTTISH